MAPKKPNWDLKRDVEKRLDVLERQTQRAILELISTLIASYYFICYLFSF